MARGSFDAVDLMELFVHWEAGRSQVQIAESLNLDRKSGRKYLGPALADGLSPGVEPVDGRVWEGRIAPWFPELTDTRLRQVTWAEIDMHRDFITAQLKDGVTMATGAQRLADDWGVSASESSVLRWIHGNLGAEAAWGKATVLRGAVEPGSEGQIDYGRLGGWVDPASGVRYVVQGFVMVLACSRMIFARPVLRMDQTSWCKSACGGVRILWRGPGEARPG